MCREVVPEIYITKMFLSKYINIDDSVKGFWECIKNYFMIVDWEDLSAVHLNMIPIIETMEIQMES